MSKPKDSSAEMMAHFAKDLDGIIAYGPSKQAGSDRVAKDRLLATQKRIKAKRVKAKKPG